jgi:hypothetical protein
VNGMGAFVVVGAGPGVGAAAARRFGSAGHPVGLIARSAESLGTMAAGLTSEGITTATETADATDEKALTAALGTLRERLGPIEVVLFSPRPHLTVVGPIGPGAQHEPDEVAHELWRLHTTHDRPLLVLR